MGKCAICGKYCFSHMSFKWNVFLCNDCYELWKKSGIENPKDLIRVLLEKQLENKKP